MDASDWLNRFYAMLTDPDDPTPGKVIQIAEEFSSLYPSVTHRAGLLMALLYEATTGVPHSSHEYLYLYNPVSEILRRTREAVASLRECGHTCPHCGDDDGVVGCAVSVPFGEVVVRCTRCIAED